MLYNYVAYTLDQGIVTGKVEANDEAEARAELEIQGIKPLEVKAPNQFSIDKVLSSLDTVKPKELLPMCRQMSTMLASGATLIRTLEMAQGEGTSKPLRKVLEAIHGEVSEGESLTRAMRQHPKVFDDVFVSLVEVGEHTGKLGPALGELADIMASSQEAKAKAVKAMMMPLFLIGSSLLMLGFMAFVAFPPLIATFEDMQVAVPFYTALLINGVSGITDNILPIFLSIVVVVVTYKVLGRVPSTAYWLDQAKARSPILGPILLAGELGRFTRVMATLLNNGVDLPSALRLAMSASKNAAVMAAWTDAEASLIEGHRIGEALARHSILPAVFVELVTIGEESNTLPGVATELADSYQKQFEDKIANVLAILEPVSTFSVGGLVLFMAMSTLKPILSAAQQVE